jgi:multidrug resistance efflux pump
MEVLFTVAYIFFIWLVHFRYKWLKFGLKAGVFYCSLYAFAILVDVILLGQVTPYAGSAAVDSVVLQLQPRWSGYIENVHVDSNSMIKKGDPILTMDKSQWQYKLNKSTAQLKRVSRLYEDAVKLTPSGAMAREQLTLRKADVDKYQALVDEATYNLKHATTYAPVNGYVPIIFLKPGMFLGVLNKNAIPFICSDQYWIVAKLKQQSVQYVKTGDPVEIALEMYPGKILNGTVVDMVWAMGNVQFFSKSALPTTESFKPSDQFFVKVKVNEKDIRKYPLKYGASAKLVIYTKESPDISSAIRRVEIRCDSFLNYIYNPFN